MLKYSIDFDNLFIIHYFRNSHLINGTLAILLSYGFIWPKLQNNKEAGKYMVPLLLIQSQLNDI